MTFTIEPIKPTEAQSGVDFGAMINDLDLEKLSGKLVHLLLYIHTDNYNPLYIQLYLFS